jgi:hypothetical protein
LYIAVGDVFYTGGTDTTDEVTIAFNQWLQNTFQSSESYSTFETTIADMEDLDPNVARIDVFDQPSSTESTGNIVGGATLIGLVTLGFAFFIHRKVKNRNDIKDNASLSSESDLGSIQSRSLRPSSNVKYYKGSNVDGDLTFPVTSNSLNTEFEVM